MSKPTEPSGEAPLPPAPVAMQRIIDDAPELCGKPPLRCRACWVIGRFIMTGGCIYLMHLAFAAVQPGTPISDALATLTFAEALGLAFIAACLVGPLATQLAMMLVPTSWRTLFATALNIVLGGGPSHAP